MLRFFLCVCIIAVIAIIATNFHQVLRCKQSEVDLVTKAAKTRRKNSCGNTTSGVAKKTPRFFSFFSPMLFLQSQKGKSSSQLGRFFHFLTFPPWPRLTHWEAAETFSDLLMQLPPGRLRCSALLNRAPLGRISWEFVSVEKIEVGRTCTKIHVLVEYGLKFWITLSICECIFENMHITGV